MSETTKDSKAIHLIRQADLSPTEHKILIDDFINQAYEPELASQEVIRRINACPDTLLEEVLRTIKGDWREVLRLASTPVPVSESLVDVVIQRDGSRCCVTPASFEQVHSPQVTHVVSPALVKLWEGDQPHEQSLLLDAFLGPIRSQALRNLLTSSSSAAQQSNVLLLTPSIGEALSLGHAQMKPVPEFGWEEVDDMASSDTKAARYVLSVAGPYVKEDISFADGSSVLRDVRSRIFTLRTSDLERLPLPGPFLLKLQFKLGRASRRFYVESQIAADVWGPPQAPSFWSRRSQLVLRSVWHLVPHFIRSLVYRQFLNRGQMSEIAPTVFALPCGLYAKHYARSYGNELAALTLLEEKAPMVPAPLLIDKFRDGSGQGWFVMTKLPGERVHDCLLCMSYPERRRLAQDLQAVIKQLHAIPNTALHPIANAAGGRLYDRRAASGGCGPFSTEAQFNAQISKGWQADILRLIPAAFSREHRFVFTHADLFLSNVLIDAGRLSGIVDWECAGFFPEYWEFTKAMRSARGPNDADARAVYRDIWGDQFDPELEVEQWLWQAFPFGGPCEDSEGSEASGLDF